MSKPKPLTAPQIKSLREIHTLFQRGQIAPARARVEKELAKHPKIGAFHAMLAMILTGQGERDRAAFHADRAIALDPTNADILTTRASIHASADEHDRARALYEKALSIHPDHPGALSGLGNTLSELGLYTRARDVMTKVWQRNPTFPDPLVNLALLELDTTRARRAIELLENPPPPLDQHPNVLNLYALAHSYDDAVTPEQVYQAHTRFGDAIATHIPAKSDHDNGPDPERTLRVGLLSPDLRRHSIAYFLEPILEHHDRSSIELHGFMTSNATDEVTARFQRHCDRWHDCFGMTLFEMRDRIIEQRIDVLIELNGHFSGHKLSVFAMRPAPVQITHIGYANTTGVRTIDARFVDDITDPAPRADALASERLVRLDPCFLCYRPTDDAPTPRDPDPARPVTLGSFNNLMKLSEKSIACWAKILNDRPNTRLLLKAGKLANQELRDELIERFGSLGIDPERLDLRARADSVADHLAMYDEIDLALDTFPYTGTTTTCEALWMGVPVLTLLGDSHAGRVSASLLRAAGLDGLTATSPDEYHDLALARIDQGHRSGQARRDLRKQVARSALLDAAAYTPKWEAAVREQWRAWCDAKRSGASA